MLIASTSQYDEPAAIEKNVIKIGFVLWLAG